MPQIESFLLPGAAGIQFKVGQYAGDTTAFVKDERFLFNLFEVISMYERGSGAKLNKGKTKAMWLGQWSNCTDEPLSLTCVKKMKLLVSFSALLTMNAMIGSQAFQNLRGP